MSRSGPTTEPYAALRLSVEVSATEAELRVAYGLENTGADGVYVFDVFFRTTPSGQRVLDREGVYVLFEGGRTVRVTRSALAVPKHLKVEYPEFPYLSFLPGGARSRAELKLRLPLHEETPYTRRNLEGHLAVTPKTLEEVVVSVGVVPAAQDLVLKRIAHFGDGVFSIRYEDAMARQRIVEAVAVRRPVPVLVD